MSRHKAAWSPKGQTRTQRQKRAAKQKPAPPPPGGLARKWAALQDQLHGR